MPEHGTYSCYTSKCADCPREDQLAARRDYDRKARRLKAYGQWRPFMDAEPVREHVNALRKSGFGSRRIAGLSGVPYKVLSALLWGVEGAEPSGKMRPWNAEALLALNPEVSERLPRSLVNATGARRRLQALHVMGWSQVKLAARLGMVRANLGQLILGKVRSVTAETDWAVRDLYDRLWNEAPPESTAAEKRAASIARKTADGHGWAPPMAWDDDTIDDPSAEPAGLIEEPPDWWQKLPSPAEVAWLHDEVGESKELIAQRFGVKPDSVRQALYRAQAVADA